MCLFVRFTAVSFQGPRDRCCDEIPVKRGEEIVLSFPRVPSSLFSLRSGTVSHNNKLKEGSRRITMTERTMTVRESSNCASPIYFSSYKRHVPPRPRRVIAPVFQLQGFFSLTFLSSYTFAINARTILLLHVFSSVPGETCAFILRTVAIKGKFISGSCYSQLLQKNKLCNKNYDSQCLIEDCLYFYS